MSNATRPFDPELASTFIDNLHCKTGKLKNKEQTAIDLLSSIVLSTAKSFADPNADLERCRYTFGLFLRQYQAELNAKPDSSLF